jgi:uncharacterized membrane protein YjjP (DUF1212 family)
MIGGNKQPDMVSENISTLRSEIAELKTEVKHINRQSESRDRWFLAIGSGLIVLAIGWIGHTLLDSYSAHKVTPVSILNNKASK